MYTYNSIIRNKSEFGHPFSQALFQVITCVKDIHKEVLFACGQPVVVVCPITQTDNTVGLPIDWISTNKNVQLRSVCFL